MDVKAMATRAAERVLDEFWGDEIPVDPARVAHALGIRVNHAHLDPDVAGAIEKRTGNPATIYLSASDHHNRKRFTCAHEIGHFVKRGNEDFEYIDYRDDAATMGIDADERFANAFAAALLMPEADVRHLRARGIDDKEMSRRFGVSPAAIVNRLKNLGIYR